MISYSLHKQRFVFVFRNLNIHFLRNNITSFIMQGDIFLNAASEYYDEITFGHNTAANMPQRHGRKWNFHYTWILRNF